MLDLLTALSMFPGVIIDESESDWHLPAAIPERCQPCRDRRYSVSGVRIRAGAEGRASRRDAREGIIDTVESRDASW